MVRRVRPDGAIVSIAGTGMRGTVTRRDRATNAELSLPAGVAAGADGSVLVADTGHNAIRSISSEGIVTTIVGAAGRVTAQLSAPGDVVALPGGEMLIADTGNHRVLRVRRQTVDVVAGTGIEGYAGDGGPAAGAMLSRPGQVSVAGDGSLLIADTGNGAVRRVLTSGVIETVASGLVEPHGAIALADGVTLVAGAAGLHAVQPDGRRQRVAGGAERTFNGNRGSALALRFDGIGQLAQARDGRVLFAERGSDRVRSLRTDGIVDTVAGSGVPIRPPALDLPVGEPPAELFEPGASQSARAAAPAGRLTAARSSAGRRASAECLRRNVNFDPFVLLPRRKAVLERQGRKRVRLRYASARVADVAIEIEGPNRTFVAKRDSVQPQPRVHRLAVNGTFKRRTYVVRLWGLSLPDGILRCDVKRLRIR